MNERGKLFVKKWDFSKIHKQGGFYNQKTKEKQEKTDRLADTVHPLSGGMSVFSLEVIWNLSGLPSVREYLSKAGTAVCQGFGSR